jgi:hypothetical protein
MKILHHYFEKRSAPILMKLCQFLNLTILILSLKFYRNQCFWFIKILKQFENDFERKEYKFEYKLFPINQDWQNSLFKLYFTKHN